MGSEPGSYKTLREYYNISPFSLDPTTFAQETAKETDRGAVVISASILEDALEWAITSRFHIQDPADLKDLRIFNFDGPLGSFSEKISMAYALGIIDNKTKSELTDIREMRNACAHSARPISFATPQLAQICKRLFGQDGSFFTLLKDDAATLRSGFDTAFVALLGCITHGSRAEARKMLKEHLEEVERDAAVRSAGPPP